jgi:glyoxylase-like metal-dependent hydrolase (beta-lactamase superfamily II)
VQAAGNVTVVEQTDGLVLIDAGGTPGAGRRVVKLVREISPKPVKAIVITHWHGDHHFGLSEVLKVWPQAIVITTVATRSHMNNRGLPAQPDPAYDAQQIANFERNRKQLAAAGVTESAPAADRALYTAGAREVAAYEEDFRGASIRFANVTFTDKLSLLDDLAPIEVMFLGRANTDGDAVAWLPKQRVVAAGDIVVSPIPFGDGSYPLEWAETLRKIRALDFAVLIPGHGMPETDTSYVDQLIAALDDVNHQMAGLVAQGLDMDAAMAKMNFSTQSNKFVTEPWLKDYFDGYWEPVAMCSYRQAKGNPAVQGKGCHL